MTRSQFQSDLSLVKELKNILDTTCMRIALDIVKSESTPKTPIISHGDIISQMALNGAESLGYNKAINSLLSLKNLTDKSINENNECYKYSALDKLISSGVYTKQELNEVLTTQKT